MLHGVLDPRTAEIAGREGVGQGVLAGEKTHRRGFDVALHAGDLPREKELRPAAELEERGEQGRGVDGLLCSARVY